MSLLENSIEDFTLQRPDNVGEIILMAPTEVEKNYPMVIRLDNHSIIKLYDENIEEYYEVIDNLFYRTNLCIIENHKEMMVAKKQFNRTKDVYTAQELNDKKMDVTIEKRGMIKWQF